MQVGTKESVLAISKVQAPALHISIKDTAEYVQTQVCDILSVKLQVKPAMRLIVISSHRMCSW